MNAHVLRRISEALAPRLLGARIEKIHALAEDVSQWSFYGHGEKLHLVLRARRKEPFLFLAARRMAVGAEPPHAIMLLRKHLIGQRVTAVFADWINRRLWLRCTHEADVWVCLDLREGPGLFWEPPTGLGAGEPDAGESDSGDPCLNNHDLRWPDASTVAALGADSWKDWPVLSPLLRRTLPLLPEAEQAALLLDLETGGGDLFVYDHPDGSGVPELTAWPLPEPLRAGRREQTFEDPLVASTLVGESLVFRELAADASVRAARPHVAEAQRLERLLDKLEREESRLGAMAAAQDDAVLMQGMLYCFGPDEKRSEIELTDATGHTHRLALDPRLTVRANMAALFHRAGRGRRGLTLLIPRREAVRAELAEARARADVAGGMAPVCVAGFGRTGPVGRGRPQQTGIVRGEPVSGLPRGVQAFRSSDGLLIVRGRDAKGNLAALKMGRPDDLWLHAEGAVGAHVIVRRQPGQEITARSLTEAGVLAALKSPYKDAGTAAIQCAWVRHVHPMRGAAPGMVRIDRHEPGLMVRVDRELETLLAAGGTAGREEPEATCCPPTGSGA